MSSASCPADHSTPEDKDLHSSEPDVTRVPRKRGKGFDSLVTTEREINQDEVSEHQEDSSFPGLMTRWEESSHLIESIGSHEGASDFSEVMVTDQASKEFPEAVARTTGAKGRLEKIIAGDNDVGFNRSC